MDSTGAHPRSARPLDRSPRAGLRGMRLVTLTVAVLVLLQIAWGLASCLGEVAASRATPPPGGVPAASRPA